MECKQVLIVHDPNLPEYHDDVAPPKDVISPLYDRCAEIAAEALAMGGSYRGVAAKLGLAYRTVAWWEQHSLHFAHLVQLKKQALREELLGNIRKAGQKEHLWTASAWYLERNKAFEGEFDPPAVRVKAEVDLTMKVFQHFSTDDVVTILEET